MRYSLGRYVYGLAVIGFGICALAFHDVSNWLPTKALEGASHDAILPSIVAIIEILGGAAVLGSRTARAGALALGALYAIFSLLTVPTIIKHPLVFDGYGNFFEVFSFVSGALILYASSGPTASSRARLARIGYYSFALCVVSFALYQLFYLSYTADLVPKWIAPGQTFWAVATTVAFALAAIALLTGLLARLASTLNTAMLLGFGLLVWVPALFADPGKFTNWTEALETLGIAGCSWIVADFLAERVS